MRKIVATGLATALLTSGCGEREHHAAEPYLPAPSAAKARQDIARVIQPYIRKDHETSHLTGAYFSDINTSRLEQIANYKVDVQGSEHEVETYGREASRKSNIATFLYATVQSQLGDVAAKYHNMDMLLYRQSDRRVAGSTTSTLNAIKTSSLLVQLDPAEMSTDASRTSHVPYEGATFPANPVGVNESISFIAPSEDRFIDSLEVAVEACQAILQIDTPHIAHRLPAQEVVCNSFGQAYAYAWNKYSYQQYEENSQKNPYFMTTDDGYFLRYFILPESAYKQIQDKQSPTQLGETLKSQGSAQS